MSEVVFSKLKELGRTNSLLNSKREELQEYCNQQFDQIIKLIPRRILNSDGECILDCILNGLPDNKTTSKVKIIELVLKAMRSESTSRIHCVDVISRLCMELPRLPLENLTKWCNDSVQSIVDDSDVNMIWCDVLPESMRILISTYDTVKHCDTEMTSAEYKEQCVHTLCQCRWSERQLVQLVAMFNDMQLSGTSHKQVVNKICTYIIDIPPDTLPPLVYQLLRLCRTYNLEIVLGHLSDYFSVRLYSKLEPPPQDSESTTMDIDDIVPHSAAELSRCLSTCISHISQGPVEPELIRKHIKMWPKTQLLKAPFIIDLALAISDKGRDFRSVCLDAIKLAFDERSMDELWRMESAWVRSVIPPDVDVASVLKVLTAESANHQQLTVIGLINLAFSLLAVSRLKPNATTCWSHGKLILVRLCKSQAETISHILSQLADRLNATDCSLKQYADCLYVLCKLTPVSVERCSQLRTILGNCRPLPSDYRSAAAVLDAVHPLLNYSVRCRDTLFMVCHKLMYSRDSLHRCLALSGFLTVLRHLRLSRGAFSTSQSICSEQYANSGYSYLAQITIDFHATEQWAKVTSRVRNEAVCMEVVSILRRCLMQDASVKQLLYTSIYDCVKEKPRLYECILEMFWEHLSKYIPESENAPLVWDKCVLMTGATAVLSEPIARLLYTIAQFLQTTEEDSLEDILASKTVDTASAHLKTLLTDATLTLDQLCAEDNLGQIDLDDPGLTDLTPESKAKCIKVQQMLQCYETLIAYRIMMWNMSSDVASNVYKLYKDCYQLLELTKGTPKLGKKGSKSLNETRETAKSQKSQKSQKENKEGPTKVANLVKERAEPFKPLPCVWDVRFCVRVIQLLYSEGVTWCSLEQRNQIVGRRDFHHWVLRCVQSVLGENVDHRAISHVLTITTILYERCVCRFQSMCEFDDQTTLSCLELFKTCLTLLLSPNYGLEMENILPKITNTNEVPISTCIATILEKIYTALMQIELESELEERDAMVKKLLAALFAIATVLLEVSTQACSNMSNVIVKLEDYIRTSKQDWLPLLPPLLAAGCREQQEAQLLDELLAKITAALGRIDPQEEDASAGAEETTVFPFVDSRSGHVVLSHACAALATRARSVSHLLTRARDLELAKGITRHDQRVDRELKELYKSVVIQLCQLTNWTSRCGKLRCSIGAGSDKVLGACVRLYSLLACLAKQIDVATAQIVSFERLLKLSGKKLSSITDKLITYLEASQAQQSATKVQRDTKLIPRLVLEAELYSKNVILLAGKAKLDWSHYLSLGTARDFSIKTSVLEEVLNTRDKPDADETRDEGVLLPTDEQAMNDLSTDVISPAPSEEDDGVTRKKRRV